MKRQDGYATQPLLFHQLHPTMRYITQCIFTKNTTCSLPALFWSPNWHLRRGFMANTWLCLPWVMAQGGWYTVKTFFHKTAFLEAGMIEIFSLLSSSEKHWQQNISKLYLARQTWLFFSNRLIKADSRNLYYIWSEVAVTVSEKFYLEN